eukprot:m.104782 g.104782  ORF g.104782 m.104782 type:complete len:180 (+) comp14187_c0_seq2:2572-3111(+)
MAASEEQQQREDFPQIPIAIELLAERTRRGAPAKVRFGIFVEQLGADEYCGVMVGFADLDILLKDMIHVRLARPRPTLLRIGWNNHAGGPQVEYEQWEPNLRAACERCDAALASCVLVSEEDNRCTVLPDQTTLTLTSPADPDAQALLRHTVGLGALVDAVAGAANIQVRGKKISHFLA